MNKTMVNIEVANIIGNVNAIEDTQGQKIFSMIRKAFDENRKVILSFLNINRLTTAFLNTAIGELYRNSPEDFIRENLEIENLNDSGIVKLKRVVDIAKLRYNDPEFYKKQQQSAVDILEQ